MSFKPVSGNLVFIKPSQITVDAQLLLQFKGNFANKFATDKPHRKYEVLEDFEASEVVVRDKTTKKDVVKFAARTIKKGEIIVLNTFGSLHSQMSELKVETILQLTYKGESELTDGAYKGKNAHSCSISVYDDSDVSQDEFLANLG